MPFQKAFYRLCACSFLLTQTIQIQAFPSIESRNEPQISLKEVFLLPPIAYNSTEELTHAQPANRSFAAFGGENTICGPAPDTNSIQCFGFSTHQRELLPIAGALSATPFFNSDTKEWLFGTNKGFLIKTRADEKTLSPQLGFENTFFWGTNARSYLNSLRPQTIYTQTGESVDEAEKDSPIKTPLPTGIEWIFSSSSEFIGAPIVQNNRVYMISSSQYLHAIDWTSGKLLWAVRLAPDTSLHLKSDAILTIQNNILLAGTSLGYLVAVQPEDGKILWSHQVPSATQEQKIAMGFATGEDKFPAIVAPLQAIDEGHQLLVSNAESLTELIDVNDQHVLWNYPDGNLGSPIYQSSEKKIFLGTAHGDVVSLNATTGAVLWKLHVSDLPIMGLMPIKDDIFLATTHEGQIFAMSFDGQKLAENQPIGEINGGFLHSPSPMADACLSFSTNQLRCFKIQK